MNHLCNDLNWVRFRWFTTCLFQSSLCCIYWVMVFVWWCIFVVVIKFRMNTRENDAVIWWKPWKLLQWQGKNYSITTVSGGTIAVILRIRRVKTVFVAWRLEFLPKQSSASKIISDIPSIDTSSECVFAEWIYIGLRGQQKWNLNWIQLQYCVVRIWDKLLDGVGSGTVSKDGDGSLFEGYVRMLTKCSPSMTVKFAFVMTDVLNKFSVLCLQVDIAQQKADTTAERAWCVPGHGGWYSVSQLWRPPGVGSTVRFLWLSLVHWMRAFESVAELPPVLEIWKRG